MKVNAKLDGCNVKLVEPIATLAPPIGPRPFMVFGVRAAGEQGWWPGLGVMHGVQGGGLGGQKQATAALRSLGVRWRSFTLCAGPSLCPSSLQADVTHPMGGEDMPSIAVSCWV